MVVYCSTLGGAIHIAVCVRAPSRVVHYNTEQLHWVIVTFGSLPLCFVSFTCRENIILYREGQDFSFLFLLRLSILKV